MGTLGQLRTEHFEHLIESYGEVPAYWLRFEGECPVCHHPRTGFSLNPACTVCGGVGVLWKQMTLPTTGPTGGKLVLQNAQLVKVKAPILLQDGDVYCTYLHTEYPFEEGDRIILDTREVRFTQQLLRGSGASDTLKHWPVTRIQAVYKSTGEVTTGFAVSTDERGITWTSGPAAGSVYTVSYWYYPTLFIVSGSFHRRVEATDGDLFPYRVVMRIWAQAPTDMAEGAY